MNTKVLIVGVVLIGVILIGAYSFGLFRSKEAIPQTTNSSESNEQKDMATIRFFMNQPNLELAFVNTDLPMPYFRVGKVTKMGNGENMEAVEGWTRQVNVYEQKELLNGTCAVYEYHTDSRSHTLTTVRIRNLRDSEIEALKKNGNSCTKNQMLKITRREAEAIVFSYLERTLPDFNQIKNQFTYPQELDSDPNDISDHFHWKWEDKTYQLPEGLEGRPYSYPTILFTVYGNRSISYQNTIPLFQE